MTNRIRSQIASMTYRETKKENDYRRSRTRTLIQLGGMVSLSGLASLIDIQEGDDLQFDIESKDKAAILLGGLSELVMMLESYPELKEKWLQKGINILKTREYRRLYPRSKSNR